MLVYPFVVSFRFVSSPFLSLGWGRVCTYESRALACNSWLGFRHHLQLIANRKSESLVVSLDDLENYTDVPVRVEEMSVVAAEDALTGALNSSFRFLSAPPVFCDVSTRILR